MIPASCAKYLTQLGYNLVDPYDTNLKKRFYNSLWVKDIVVSGFNIRLGVFFSDWDFINPPRVYLFEDDLIEVNTMNDAVRMAQRYTEKGDAVLLSPACASFDLFENYEDRGRQFKQAVYNL